MNIFITGVSGFSGSFLAEKLSYNFNVYGIYRNDNSTYLKNIKNKHLNLFKLDLNNIEKLNNKIDKIDFVIHAGSTSPNKLTSNQKLLEDNILGMNNLVNWSIKKKCKKFIFFSSLSAFGEIKTKVVTENNPSINPDFYGLTKLMSERLLFSLRDILPSVSIRLPGIIGPGSQRNWLSNLKKELKTNKHITVFNPKSYFNNLIHVDDLIKLSKNILNKKFAFETILVGAKQKLKILDIVDLISKELKKKPIIKIAELKKESFIINSNKATNNFNYKPEDIRKSLIKFANDF